MLVVNVMCAALWHDLVSGAVLWSEKDSQASQHKIQILDDDLTTIVRCVRV